MLPCSAFILDSSGLTSFAGLGALQSVGADLTVSNNNALTSFSGFDSFQMVGGNLTITSNPALPSGAAQAFANQITVNGSVQIN